MYVFDPTLRAMRFEVQFTRGRTQLCPVVRVHGIIIIILIIIIIIIIIIIMNFFVIIIIPT